MLHTFWTNLTSSIYNPEFYGRVLRGEKMRTKSFVALFSLVAALVACLWVYPGVVGFRDAVGQLPGYINDVYPETMVLTVNPAGELSVAGVEQPVKIGFGQFGANGGTEGAGFGFVDGSTHLAVIDTATEYTPDAHTASEALVWVGKTFMTTKSATDAERQMYAYVDMMEGTKEPVIITKTDADKAARAMVGFAGYVVPVTMVFTALFAFMFYMFGMLVFGVIIGGIIYSFGRMSPAAFAKVLGKEAELGFVPAMRAAIFAGVLPSVVTLVSWFTPVTITYMMYTLATLVVVFVNVRGFVGKKVE